MPFLLPSQVPADARELHLVALDESQSALDNIQIISGYYPDHIWIISEVWILSKGPRGLLDFIRMIWILSGRYRVDYQSDYQEVTGMRSEYIEFHRSRIKALIIDPRGACGHQESQGRQAALIRKSTEILTFPTTFWRSGLLDNRRSLPSRLSKHYQGQLAIIGTTKLPLDIIRGFRILSRIMDFIE